MAVQRATFELSSQSPMGLRSRRKRKHINASVLLRKATCMHGKYLGVHFRISCFTTLFRRSVVRSVGRSIGRFVRPIDRYRKLSVTSLRRLALVTHRICCAIESVRACALVLAADGLASWLRRSAISYCRKCPQSVSRIRRSRNIKKIVTINCILCAQCNNMRNYTDLILLLVYLSKCNFLSEISRCLFEKKAVLNFSFELFPRECVIDVLEIFPVLSRVVLARSFFDRRIGYWERCLQYETLASSDTYRW